jgi:hypothetical protein
MKATLTIATKPPLTFEVGFDDLANFVSNLPDTDDMAKAFAQLARHPSSQVRESVARKDHLDEDTVNFLVEDSDAGVLRSLVSSDKARSVLSTAALLKILAKDLETAEEIAGYFEAFESVDADDMAAALIGHSDPRVRNALAGNSGTPTKYLKTLLKDSDPRVRSSAKQTLEDEF